MSHDLRWRGSCSIRSNGRYFSFGQSFDSTRRDSEGRWLWRLVGLWVDVRSRTRLGMRERGREPRTSSSLDISCTLDNSITSDDRCRSFSFRSFASERDLVTPQISAAVLFPGSPETATGTKSPDGLLHRQDDRTPTGYESTPDAAHLPWILIAVAAAEDFAQRQR
jgi:hypothetical protein